MEPYTIIATNWRTTMIIINDLPA